MARVSGYRTFRWIGVGLAVAVLVGTQLRPGGDSGDGPVAYAKPATGAWSDGEEPSGVGVRLGARAFGYSGALLTVQALPSAEVDLPLEWLASRPAGAWYRWIAESGEAGDRVPFAAEGVLVAPSAPGVYRLEVGSSAGTVVFDAPRLIVKVPFAANKSGRIGSYRIGRFPTEGQGRTDRYAPPRGFIEVPAADRSLRLSKHFTVGEFLTKDQHNVWPKYVVVDPLLLDKLELVMQELNAMGVRAERMHVMSGFRTPQYNRQGVGRGRASLSRHQYGDAADVWIDNDGDGYMDDLNGDGRRDAGDARVILEAVERVERRYPELVGGAGIYSANRVRGPFIHIDARGQRARW